MRNKNRERYNYYKRIRYYRIEFTKFIAGKRDNAPTCCYTCGYSKCLCAHKKEKMNHDITKPSKRTKQSR